ncbi:MAG TPA: Fur family transcriptional regulator [Thermoanaerobaculia bacterium]|nr:Fur family transcriptional regulator [Thermoanaerobaculia bacterium]
MSRRSPPAAARPGGAHRREAALFRAYLQRRGLKLTPERRDLFDEIFKRHEHFEADELLFRLKQRGRKISRATIYRGLELLRAAGVVGRVRVGDEGFRYERLHAGEHHDHMICLGCGRIIEFYEPKIEELQDRVCARVGFRPVSHSHHIRGFCRDCRRSKPAAGEIESASDSEAPARDLVETES